MSKGQTQTEYRLKCRDCHADGVFTVKINSARSIAKVHEEQDGHEVDILEVDDDV